MNQRLLTTLTLVNLALLTSILFHESRPVHASSPMELLQARKLEIVDGAGRVRASIQVLPAGPALRSDGTAAHDGKVYAETVLFRLIRPDGRPSVKIATSEEGSGLALGGGIDPTYVTLGADGGNPSLSLINQEGRQRLIKP